MPVLTITGFKIPTFFPKLSRSKETFLDNVRLNTWTVIIEENMDLKSAIEKVKMLANGINPINGERLPAESPYNNSDVIRALFFVLNYVPKQKKSPEEKQQENLHKGLPRNYGLVWTDEARKQVASLFRAGEGLENLATTLERSKTAIVAELHRQGLLTIEQASSYGVVIHQRY